MTHALPFARMLRTRNVYSASSADQLPQMLAALRMFGHLALIPVPDLERTDYFLIFGANPVVSNGSLMTAPDMKSRLRAIRDRGGRIVVVDPRRTETAEAADEHVAIRPGTDALLLAAMLHVVFAEGWVRLGRLEGRVTNIDALAHLVRSYSPERVARRTGVAPDVTRRIAGEFARTTRAACYGRVGLCTQKHGTLASWLVQALNLVTGHLDEVGGMMLTTPAVDAVAIMSRLGMRGTFGRWRSRARHLPEFSGDPPIATLADEIELERPGTACGRSSPSPGTLCSPRQTGGASTAPSARSSTSFRSTDTSTRQPATRTCCFRRRRRSRARTTIWRCTPSPFAMWRNTTEPVVPQQASERLDWEIVTELAGRVFVPRPLRRIALRAARHVRPERIVDALLRVGPHRLTLAKLRRFPHGLDLGPLEPGRFKDRIATPDRMADLAPKDLVREAEIQLPAEADRDATGELLLIGRRQLRDNNSWMHNSRRLVKGPSRCTLLIHPSDAASRHLTDGDLARLGSDVGTIVVPVEVTDAMRPGVVSLPHGWGHDREGVRLDTAREHAGASMNDVTSDHHLDTLSGNAGFSGLPVTLVRTGG